MWKKKICRGVFLHAKSPNVLRKGVLKMEVLNLVLFGCVFYLALIVIPTLCEKRGKGQA